MSTLITKYWVRIYFIWRDSWTLERTSVHIIVCFTATQAITWLEESPCGMTKCLSQLYKDLQVNQTK